MQKRKKEPTFRFEQMQKTHRYLYKLSFLKKIKLLVTQTKKIDEINN